MENLRTKIKELLIRSIVVRPDLRDTILQKLETFSPERLQKIHDTLQNADLNQHQFLEKTLEANPELLDKIKHAAQTEFKKEREDTESQSRHEEENILADLDKELELLVV